MINAYKELTTHDGDDWQEFLEKICLFEIFKELIIAYQHEPGLVKCIIRYIVWAYSKDSDKVILGEDWMANKKRIYEAADLPPTEQMQENILYYKDDVVLLTIKKWIQHQDSDAYTEITMLQDLRTEMQISANSDIKNANDETNYDQKFKNAKYSIELYHMIKDATEKLIQKDVRFKDAMNEIRKASKTRTTVGPETFAK
jgi:hypothetical protein